MKWIVSLLCFFPLALFGAAANNPTDFTIETNGWVADIKLSNANAPSNGKYTNDDGMLFGYGTNNVPNNPVIQISVASPGFDTTGASNTVYRKVFGTRELRAAYPNYTNIAFSTSGQTLTMRVALSDYIFSTDYSLSVSIAQNWYQSNVSTNLTPVNSSTITYAVPKVIGNWTMPNYDMIRGSTFTLRCTAFQQFAQNGQPVACVVFKARDAHSHTNTVTVTKMTISNYRDDATPICEYIATMDASGLTDGDTITCDFRAYPWIGDTTSVMDTSDGKFAQGTPFYHSLSYVLNKAGAFSQAWAVLDAAGNDSTGLVVKTNITNFSQRPPPFLTMAAAWTAIKGTNNAVSGGANNTVAGGTLYLNGTWSYASVPNDTQGTYVWIATYPSNASKAVINGGPCSTRSGGLLCFSNITIDMPASAACPFFNHKAYWCDGVYLTNKCTGLFDQGIQYFTDCVVSNNSQGFQQAEASQQPVHLMRGNYVWGPSKPWNCFNLIGNLSGDTNSISSSLLHTTLSGNLYTEDYAVIAYNRFLNVNNSGGSTFNFWGVSGSSEHLTNGAAIVQNVFEQTAGAGPTFLVHADSATGGITNCMLWQNTWMGFWDNVFYNDSGSAAVWNIMCNEIGDVSQSRHSKTDTFAGTANGARIGNWASMWGVGRYGNYDMQTTNITASGTFVREFAGVNSFQPAFLAGAANPLNSEQKGTNYPSFTLDASYGPSNNGNGPGFGNYRLLTKSPLQIPRTIWIIPYDIEGLPRGGYDPAGAYASGAPEKGGGFFNP